MIDIECRRFPRFPFHGKGVVIFPAAYRDVALRDISMHGALVETRYGNGLMAGAKCTLRVLSGNDRQAFETEATVARAMNGRNIGLEFADMHAGAKRALYQLIEANLGNESFAKRDLCVLLKSSDHSHSGSSASVSGASGAVQ